MWTFGSIPLQNMKVYDELKSWSNGMPLTIVILMAESFSYKNLCSTSFDPPKTHANYLTQNVNWKKGWNLVSLYKTRRLWAQNSPNASQYVFCLTSCVRIVKIWAFYNLRLFQKFWGQFKFDLPENQLFIWKSN